MELTVTDIRKSDPALIRRDFPLLETSVYGKPLIYFDNAASSQKPFSVIQSLTDYYSNYNANVHRGVHFLSRTASEMYEQVREKAARFINASSSSEIIFVRGTTEGINLVAATFGRMKVKEGDEILITAMEHHSNIVPWQLLCEEKGATLKVIPMNEHGELILEKVDALLNERTRMLAVVHTSNVLGTVNPVKELIKLAHAKNIPVSVDGAQAAAHEMIDVQDLDCDFFACSSHKMFGPTGIGILYGKRKWLEEMPPYQGGGEMIRSVSFEKSTWNDLPFKFEAGTPNIADTIAFGVAIDYINSMDREAVYHYEQQLLIHATTMLQQIPEVRLIGTAQHKTSLVTFVVDGVNALDLGMYLDTKGIAVRTGHHCAEPVMDFYGVPSTLRASFMFYNTTDEINYFEEQLKNGIQFLKKK